MSNLEDRKLMIEKTSQLPIAYKDLYLKRLKRIINNLNSFKRELKINADLLKLGKNSKIIDIGCGFGFHLIEFATFGCDCVGLEIIKESAKISKITSVNSKPKLEIVVGDACNLPFNDNSFDAVYSNEFFSHVKDIDIALAEQLRILKKGGKLLIRDGNFLCPPTIFDLLICYPLRTKLKYGGLKWLFTHDKPVKNIYGHSFVGKDENIKTLQWWKQTIRKHGSLKLKVATTSYAYRHPGIVSKILEPFLGQILLLGEKI